MAHVLTPDGSVAEVPDADLKGLLAFGFTPASPQQVADFEARRAYRERFGSAGQQALTLGEAAVSAATFGLSRHLEANLLDNEKEQAARKDVNPGAALAGEIVGTIGPAIASGGSSLAARGALRTAASLTGPGLAVRAGDAGASAVAKAVGSASDETIHKIVQKALSTGAGSAIEGAAYGAGHVVSEAALGDPSLTAEAVAARVGAGALIGAVGGTVLGGSFRLADGLLWGGPRTAERLSRWAGDLQGSAALRATGGVTRSEIRRAARQKGGVENLIQLGREADELGLVPPGSNPGDVLAKTQELKEKLGPGFERITRYVDSVLKPEEAPSISGVAARFRGTTLAELSDDPLQAGAAQKLNAVMESYERKFATEAGGMSFSDLHDLRHQLDRQLFGIKGSLDPDRTVVTQGLRDLRRLVNEAIEGTISKAKGVPEDTLREWKTVNRQWSVASTIEDLAQKGLEREVGNQAFSLTDKIVGAAAGVGALPDILTGGATGFAAAIGHRILREHGPAYLARGAGRLAHALDGAPALAFPPGVGAAARAEFANMSAETGEALLREASREGAIGVLVNRTGDLEQRSRMQDGAGLPDATAIGDDPEKVAVLAELERQQREVREEVGELLDDIVGGRVADKGPPRDASATDHEGALDVFQKRLRILNLYGANPESLLESLEATTDGWFAHAPQTAGALNAVTARAVAFLTSKIPSPPQVEGRIGPYEPNLAELAAFNGAWDAVHDPMSVLRSAVRGTLVPEEVEALREVYPQLYLEALVGAVLRLPGDEKEIPYRSRLVLSLLLGTPIDETLAAGSFFANQASYARSSAKAQGFPAPISPSRKVKTDLPGRTRTPTQAAAARHSEP